MQVKDLENVLNAMPETGVYVIQAEDHRLLYFNQRAKEVTPGLQMGRVCHPMGGRDCRDCPIQTSGERQENCTISYSEFYGGVVEVTASRILWEDTAPAWVLTVIPHLSTAGHTYRKIMKVDLQEDCCKMLKYDPDSWHPGEGSFSAQMEQFANSGAIYPDDIERLVAFTRVEFLRTASDRGQDTLSISYRRRDGGGSYRWNLMEVVPNPVRGERGRSAILCVKDVHDLLREGLKRSDHNMRTQELIRSLGEQNFDIFTVDLRNGVTVPVWLDGHLYEGMDPEPIAWEDLMRAHIQGRLQEAYWDEFERRFSLEALRQSKAEGRQKNELLCRWRSGETYRYISVTAYFSQKSQGQGFAVLTLQDVDDHMRQELAHTERDMQMASILQARFTGINSVNLKDGTYEKIDLKNPVGAEQAEVLNYAETIQDAVYHIVHPDDMETFWATVSLDHLRSKAESVEDYAEELCEYRRRTDPPTWAELHVMYRRQKDGLVLVDILERDITREKQREASQRKVLEDRANIISSMSSLFFTTYYIDLENDTFRPVHQLRKVGDVLGDEVNCSAALHIYANHFVHPDDREEYLKIMSVENLRESLRWWQPYVAVEYRRLPEDEKTGECGWVRATAVLARSAAGDLPGTAVYVAQDISDRNRTRA